MATRPPKAIRFEPRWQAGDKKLKAAIERLADFLEGQERRTRHRRAADRALFLRRVAAIVCNLLAVRMVAPDIPLACPRGNNASRVSPIFGPHFRKLIDRMATLGLVSKSAPGYRFSRRLRRASTIEATPAFNQHIPVIRDWRAFRLADDPTAKCVILKPDGDSDSGDRLLAYRDTQATRRWSREVKAINARIRGAAIECNPNIVAHIAEAGDSITAMLITPHHRTLRRIFNATWKQGGRLFGGYWQTMPRADRFREIHIDGEQVANVDYGQLFLRLAYAEARIAPPPGDLYDMTGNDNAFPDWKRLREGRKKLVNALFFREASLKQWPGATIKDRQELRECFSPGTKPSDAIKAIKRKHAAIADWFERGHGLRFMRRESDLIVAVTLALLRRGITALPIHDAVLVAERHAATAKAVMEMEAKKLTGARIPADIETAADFASA